MTINVGDRVRIKGGYKPRDTIGKPYHYGEVFEIDTENCGTPERPAYWVNFEGCTNKDFSRDEIVKERKAKP